MKRNRFFRILICLLRVIREGSILLGVAGIAEHLFQSGSVISSCFGSAFLLLSFLVLVALDIIGGAK